MNTHADQIQDNKSQSVANEIDQKRGGIEPTFQFVDNRPEAVAQRKLQGMANNNGPRVSQLRTFQKMANNSQQVKHAVQLKSLEIKSSNIKIIQQRKYKDKDIKNEIKLISDDVQPNSKAIILAVYNQMRHELDPTPKAFNSVKDGRDAMIKAGKFDNDDADFLEAEATRRQKAAGDPAQLIKLQAEAKIDEKYAAVNAKYGHHIFQGDFKKGSPTGFHSTADGSATHEPYGAKTNLGSGTYQQSVRSKADNTKKKTNQSTFFPDNATHENIIKAIASVYEAGFKNVSYVDPTVDGLSLTRRGNTVYPSGGSDARLAE